MPLATSQTFVWLTSQGFTNFSVCCILMDGSLSIGQFDWGQGYSPFLTFTWKGTLNSRFWLVQDFVYLLMFPQFLGTFLGRERHSNFWNGSRQQSSTISWAAQVVFVGDHRLGAGKWARTNAWFVSTGVNQNARELSTDLCYRTCGNAAVQNCF